jgi:hypothetical protein
VYRRNHWTLLLLGAVWCCNAPLLAQPLQENATPPMLADPMRPPAAAAPATAPTGGNRGDARASDGGYRISAIRISSEQRSATINGTTVGVGDHLGHARVSAIHASHVTLLQAGKSITIPLLPHSIKKPVEAPRQ